MRTQIPYQGSAESQENFLKRLFSGNSKSDVSIRENFLDRLFGSGHSILQKQIADMLAQQTINKQRAESKENIKPYYEKPIVQEIVKPANPKPKNVLAIEPPKADPKIEVVSELSGAIKEIATVLQKQNEANMRTVIEMIKGEPVKNIKTGEAVSELEKKKNKRQWHFSATRTSKGFDIDATEK